MAFYAKIIYFLIMYFVSLHEKKQNEKNVIDWKESNFQLKQTTPDIPFFVKDC